MYDNVILASTSLRRRQLLNNIGLEFSVVPSLIDEDISETDEIGFGPAAAKTAFRKALAVAGKLDNGLVIGADTIVVLGDEILGKPDSLQKAKEMLTQLGGKWHSVYTGLSLVDASSKEFLNGYEESKVKFKDLSEQEIQNYVNTKEPMDKAGAYGIQGKGALFVERIEGDYYNIVGLPLFRLNTMLTHFNMKIL